MNWFRRSGRLVLGRAGFIPFLATAALAVVLGCAGPGPTAVVVRDIETDADLEPQDSIAPAKVRSYHQRFDTDQDGIIDFVALGLPGEPLTILALNVEPGGEAIELVDRSALCGIERTEDVDLGDFAQSKQSTTRLLPADAAQLLIIQDSVPFELIREAWEQGRFAWFHRPSRIISPFPVMTDPALVDFFGGARCPGPEAEFFDGSRLVGGLGAYLAERNAPWIRFVDYRLAPWLHGNAYSEPRPWFLHELGRVERRFLAHADAGTTYIAYLVGGSTLGSHEGRAGHEWALDRIEALCALLMERTRGRLTITFMSDHGQHFATSELTPVVEMLRKHGFEPGSQLTDDRSVVVPAWGEVSYAAVYTRMPEEVAAALAGEDVVELAAYRAIDGSVTVLTTDGEARITREAREHVYTALRGDPLMLLAANAADPEERIVREPIDAPRFLDHEFPDPLDRLWRAFDDMFEHTPAVMVSLRDGVHTGSEGLATWLSMEGVHGSLRPDSTNGFVMTTAGVLPVTMRMRDARAQLEQVGVHVRGAGDVAMDDAEPVAASHAD